jgi:ubiquinone/menaquinone biosynthesis C-methylase UbiE/uncharacterized OsmC-like protein
MEAKFQRRIQRYGWDRAVGTYEQGWQAQLTPAHDLMLKMMPPQPGERVLDVACGTGLVSLRLAAGVGEQGCVVGTDISERMVEAASSIASKRNIRNVQFWRHDAEALPFPDGSFDAAVCALGLMYVPDPVRAMREMRRLVNSDGRVAVAVWGARQRCGWAAVFPITDARVASEVCPLFFQLGTGDTLARAMTDAGFADVRLERISTTLGYASAEAALAAVFRGGPVALAYSRFDEATRDAAHGEYLDSIAAYRVGDGYRIPGEFVVATARTPFQTRQPKETPMTVSATTVNNGVNVEALIGAREALSKAPEAAQFRWRATCDWMNGTHSRATVSGFFGLGQDQKRKTEFRFDADHPEVFASEDLGATPVEYVLVGLGACLTAGIAAVAQHRRIQLRSVSATIEGAMDIQGILGVDGDVRNGFEAIRVSFKVDADATADEIKALVAQSQKRSAVFDIVTNPTNVTVEVV